MGDYRPDRRRLEPQWVVVATLLPVFLVLATFLSLRKEVWYDELFTIYAGKHLEPFRDMLWHHWLPNNHPPLFLTLTWLVEPLVGDAAPARRALNVVPLVLTGSAFWFIARRYQAAAFVAAFSVLLLSFPATLDYFIEHRSNFAQLCATSVLLAGIFAIDADERDFERRDLGLALIVVLAIVTSLNLHFIQAALSGLVLGIVIIREWWSQRPRWASVLLLGSISGGCLLLTTVLAQRSAVLDTTRTFWAATGGKAAVMILVTLILTALLCNVAIAAEAVVGSGRTLRGGMALALRHNRYLLTMAGVALSLCVAIVILNQLRPFLIPRYALTLIPVLLAVIAAAAQGIFVRNRLFLALMALSGLISMGFSALHLRKVVNWDGTGRIIGRIAARCPTVAVHGQYFWKMGSPVQHGSDDEALIQYGYRVVGRNNGFRVEPAGSTRVDPHCPTIVWVEHYLGAPPPTLAKAAVGLPLDARAIARGTRVTAGIGMVAIYPAPSRQ